MEKGKIINNKKGIFKQIIINKKNLNKNIALEKQKKTITKGNNIKHKTNNSLALQILDKSKLLNKENSNNLNISYNTVNKSISNKAFLSNSCKRRQKNHLKVSKTNNLFNKTKYIQHTKLLSTSPYVSNNYNKCLEHLKTNQNKKFNNIIYESYNNFNKIIKANNTIKANKIIFRNKNSLSNNKILNRSVELRNKNKKYQLDINTKRSLIKNKSNTNNTNIEKIERLRNKEINNQKHESLEDNNKYDDEICQTFSNKENNDTLEIHKNIEDKYEKNKNFNTLKISTDYEKNINREIKEKMSIPKTSTSKDRMKKKILINTIKRKKELKIKGNKKMNYLIREFCINNSRLNNNKNNLINKKENKRNKNDNNDNNNFFTQQTEKRNTDDYNNNNEIFEIMSDIKVKSYNEYEKEKEKKTNEKSETDDKNKINNNININININYNTINVNNTNSLKDDFIEDRDEYNNFIKETFSKDRFSFKPINNEIKTDFDAYKTITMRKKLDKNDFINNDENKKENEKKNIKIKEKNINIKGEKNKVKKFFKHKVESKINKEISSLKKQIVIKRKNK